MAGTQNPKRRPEDFLAEINTRAGAFQVWRVGENYEIQIPDPPKPLSLFELDVLAGLLHLVVKVEKESDQEDLPHGRQGRLQGM